MIFSIFRKESFISLAIFISALAVSSFIIVHGGSNAFAQQSSGLVSRWNGDAASGTTAKDISGGNNGTLAGGVSVVSGQSGKAFQFDGSSGRISMGNPGNLNFGTGPFSLEARFMWDGGGPNVNNIIRKSNYGPGIGSGYWMRIAKYNKTIEFSVGATVQSEGQTLITSPITSGVWHQVIATRDSSDTVKLYVDGQSTGAVVRQASQAQSTSGSAFALGFWPDQNSEFFSGLIQEAAVYNRALDAGEVKAAYAAVAQKSEIVFPIPELGGCASKDACRAYCDKPENSRACLAFVKAHNILSPEEIAKWEKFIDVATNGGPGGCKNEKECVTYCQDSVHIVECTDFVEKYNLVSPEELAQMRKIASAVKGGAKLPGVCHSKAECVAYCQDPNNSKECADFLEKAQIVSHEDAEFIRKSQGKSPGDCARGAATPEDGKKACTTFCAKSENQKVCMDFAVQVGLISADDAKELGGGGSLEDFNACLPHIDPKLLKCFDVLGKDVFDKLKAGQVPEDLKDMKDMIVKMKDVRACVNRGVDESFGAMPPDGFACLEKELGPNPLEQIKSGRISCKDFSGVEERIKACMMDKQSGQLDACLNLSCSEVAQCVKKLSGGRPGQEEDQSHMDPAITAKMDQIKTKIKSCAVEQIRGCLAQGCGEMMACMNKLQAQSGGSREEGKNDLDPNLQQEMKAKMTACSQPKGGAQGGSGGGTSSGGAGGCGEQGGVWNGKQCIFSQKGTGTMDAAQCIGHGGVWNGTQCDFSQKGINPDAAAACTKQGGNWDGTKCIPPPLPGQNPSSGQNTQPSSQIPQDQCSSFASVPNCSYVGSPDSQNYKYCKQCFPDK